MARIGWIDFSSEHRDRVRTVIDLLSAPGILDELGIGVVIASFSDRMFPGISTIQTRAKYFTLTALLLQHCSEKEGGKKNARKFDRYLEEQEKLCRVQLVEKHGEGRGKGIIGGLFGLRTDRDVVRRPSSIYWSGLQAFGMIAPRKLSLSEFARRISDDKQQFRALLEDRGDERGDDPDAEDRSSIVRIKVPEVDDDYWNKLSIDMTRSEAEFLHYQIVACQPQSLIGQILSNKNSLRQVLKLSKGAGFAEFAELPFLLGLKDEELKRTVQHARDFWRILEGAHIRYNCILQQRFGTPELRNEFEERWDTWCSEISSFPPLWDSSFLWSVVAKHGSRVKGHTRIFIDAWIEQSQLGGSNERRCNELVIQQELLNKRSRARLKPGYSESVDNWVGLSGAGYRITQVIQILRDIDTGERDL